jgi:hypothetical protein
MDDFIQRVSSHMSAARRHAESMMVNKDPEARLLKQELERKRQATAAKSERLRQLRLAKEAAERDAIDSKPVRQRKRKVRRIKCY